MLRIGIAGWALPASFGDLFPGEDSHLGRYSRVFGAVEINSSFYRPHRRSTYARWGATVPESFRFSVKAPKTITHDRRLVGVDDDLRSFIDQIGGLGTRLGCILVQLPPSLEFEPDAAAAFFSALRARHEDDVAFEPRHPSWFGPASSSLLERYRCARVAADPAVTPEAAEPGGWPGFQYWRLHGAPRMYASPYDDAYLAALAANLNRGAGSGKAIWCIFDNTMFGAAYGNALALQAQMRTVEAASLSGPE